MRIVTVLFAFAAIFLTLSSVKADSVYDVLNVINSTGYTIRNVNNTGRSTMSTVEYAQRFTDRRQERLDEKRAQKEYSQDAEEEYYKTLEETRQLQQQIERNGNNL